jgi:hypothetical protein
VNVRKVKMRRRRRSRFCPITGRIKNTISSNKAPPPARVKTIARKISP